MSKLYDDVKKQGEQIDDLQKTATNHGTRIETLETKAKATPPQAPAMPSEVKVVLPDDIARKSDIEEAVTKITRKCNAGERPIPQSVTVTVSALDALEKVEYDKAIRKAVKDEILNTDKKVVENNSILKRIENRQNRSDNEVNAFKIVFVINAVIFIASVSCYSIKTTRLSTLNELNGSTAGAESERQTPRNIRTLNAVCSMVRKRNGKA